MNDFKAIETSYKGYKFRSRTEARWAIFFDACGIEWKYEHEGYDLGDLGFYLPDFWLPGGGYAAGTPVFAEVKGQEFSVKETNLCRRLALKSGHPVFMLAGVPEVQSYRVETPTGLLTEQVWRSDSKQVVVEAVAQARSARFEHGETPVNVMPWVQPEIRARRGERRTQHVERGASAERELIRAMLSDRTRVEWIAEKLAPESFREPRYQAVYRVLLSGTLEATSDTDATVKEILDEGAGQTNAERVVADSLATLRARDLDRRAAELDRLIPLAAQPEKDNLIEEKEAIRSELKATGRNYFGKFRRSGA